MEFAFLFSSLELLSVELLEVSVLFDPFLKVLLVLG